MPLPPPVPHVVPDYPKHVYRSKKTFADEEDLKAGFRANLIETKHATSPEHVEELAAHGWVESPGDLIGEQEAEAPRPRRGRPPKTETAEA